MMYLLAILLPPVAVLFCGKPFQAIINFILTLIFGFQARYTQFLSYMIKKPTGDLKNKFKRMMKLIKEIEGKLRLTYKKERGFDSPFFFVCQSSLNFSIAVRIFNISIMIITFRVCV